MVLILWSTEAAICMVEAEELQIADFTIFLQNIHHSENVSHHGKLTSEIC
jgi:hypothetical protein